MQVRPVRALVCSLIIIGSSASSALAANTGGSSATETTAPSAPVSTAPKIHLFPVTARSRSVAYKGPVYVKTATGEVLPYVPGTPASATTGSAASTTGGASVTPGAPAPSSGVPAELTSGSGMTAASGPVARPQLLVPGTTARYVGGLAAAPMSAPAAIQQIIWAGNELIGLPYVYGGGHASFHLPRLRLLGHRLLRPARREPAAHSRWTPRNSKRGARRAGPLGHHLHEPGPRLHDDRRPAPRHERRR